MAKVTITVFDKSDGFIGVTMDFDPPIKTAEDATPAQRWAVEAVSGNAPDDAEVEAEVEDEDDE